MEITFGIVTFGQSQPAIDEFLASVERNSIPIDKYEVLVVGGDKIGGKNVRHIPFDETLKESWITRKKNLVTENAKFDIVVYMHDYIILDDGWYEGFIEFGDDWEVCMNRIQNLDGNRFRDWVLGIWMVEEKGRDFPSGIRGYRGYILPYDITHLTQFHYISGAYWVAKKQIMLDTPLDEELIWGKGEDLDWSRKMIARTWNLKMNTISCVKFTKQKSMAFTFTDAGDADILRAWQP